MHQTTKSAGGTSFHGHTVNASVAHLKSVLGTPMDANNSGEDKTNFEWTMETETGDVFTVYDWKHYRPLSETERVNWHIGARTSTGANIAKSELMQALLKA